MRWSETRMSEVTKDEVRTMLTKRVYDMGQKITEDNVTLITEHRSLAKKFSHAAGPAAADVAWSWVAEQQEGTEGLVADELERRTTGMGSSAIPRWRWISKAQSGWEREEGLQEQDVQAMMVMDQVLKHLVQQETGKRWEEWCAEGEEDEEEESGCLTLSKGTVRKAWLKAKRIKALQGTGGYGRYLEAVATLMVGGELEGTLEEDPRAAGWWQRAVETGVRVWGKEAVVNDTEGLDWTAIDDHEEGTSLAQEAPDWTEVNNIEEGTSLAREEGVMLVVVDWMSCTQSLRKAVAEIPGVDYVGLDIQEWVFSHAMRGWVRNVPIDLTKIEPALLWATVEQEVQHRRQAMVKVELLLLSMSPCCKTFSKADSSNTSRGHNYRLHGQDYSDRPPKDDHSEKGIEAIKADEMVKRGIELAIWLVNAQQTPGQGAAFYMENPVGSLWRRPYMEMWEDTGMVTRKEVHYCAFDHFYHKPTHIWTNMEWTPRGTTGSGLCEHRCRGGRWENNQWVHQYKIAQGSWQAKGGRGRKAHKNMMPAMLHRELLEAAVEHKRRSAEQNERRQKEHRQLA